MNVPEDTPLHRSIAQVKADDADLGVNGEVYFSLADANSPSRVSPLPMNERVNVRGGKILSSGPPMT